MDKNKLNLLADDLSRAISVKESARLRRQCTLEEWQLVLAQAKKVYDRRKQYQRTSILQ